nr:hypothetical protein [Pseudomonadota bacterium]
AQAAVLPAMLAFLAVSPVLAQTATTPTATTTAAAPDPHSSPILSDLINQGGKVYYLGNRSGLDGWLLLKDGQMQVAYVTADKQGFIVGVLFVSEGYDITHDQIQAATAANPELGPQMTEALKRSVGGEPGLSSAGPAPSMRLPSQTLPSGTAGGTSLSGTSLINSLLPAGERLLEDLRSASGIDVGDAKAAVIYMVMDPNCPHCQATWKMLRDAVFKNTLRIHLVPIGRNDEDERAAAQLLHSADPLNVWDKYVAGDKTQLTGTPDAKWVDGVRANHVLTDKWSINTTPYLVYQGKDGKVKILAGEPKDAASLQADVGP